ncbi:alpha/beta hydrolase family protein [Undibacterium sp. TJN25]|uniref:S9 family peptidase n=1 Tax=Undibacterium sp. TJN25 TaxID=3413056 RepID=UPI003BEFD8B8
MQNVLLRIILPLAIACSMVSPSVSAAEQTLPSVETFFQPPKLSSVAFSPDGLSIALLMNASDNRRMLATMDVATLAPKVVAHYSDADVRTFHWVNNHRLVYDLNDDKIGIGNSFFGAGLFAVDKDGSSQRELVGRTGAQDTVGSRIIVKSLPWYTYFAATVDSGDSDDIFVMRDNAPFKPYERTYDLLQLNTVTGHAEAIRRPGEVASWLIDGNGVPRFATTNDKSNSQVYYNDPKDGNWQKLTEFPKFSSESFKPMAITPDGRLLVRANNGKDTSAVYFYDLEKKQLDSKPLISLPGYDFSGSILFDRQNKKILGIRYETDARATTWLDSRMKQIQQKVDEQIPGLSNVISVPERGKTETVLVFSYSDTYPGVWQLYNTASNSFTPIGTRMLGIDPKQMATKDMVRYKARDGLEIPAYLTLPKGKKKDLPMVVLVHGGPYVRGGHWEWDAEAQFLASRGYAVLEPEFRGSTGYGSRLFSAGLKQWGLAMQDDIADGTKWAIEKGYANPDRICIAGASYGGYATLMGLIRNPELFRCGIDWVGVTDINLLYNIVWSDLDSQSEKYDMPLLVGDQIKDAEQLKATSPLRNAAKITQPLLLAYGGSDTRVPIDHGTAFYRAVKATNSRVEWVEYPEEGHGWRLLKNNVDFWTRVEKFLGQNIGQP